MLLLRNPIAIAVMLASLVGLVFVLGASLGLVVGYARRRRLTWARSTRIAVGAGGTITSCLVLCLPAAAAWLAYLSRDGKLGETLAIAAPEQVAALVAQAFESALGVSLAATISELVVAVPCAVLAGLALTVPFFLRAEGGGS
jgi:ABC-type dipeptide/oligopeptide/nickel transport system permease component